MSPLPAPEHAGTPAGRVFNIQRFSVHDGPGIRTTVFLKGCPARCPWCHNPESQSSRPELLTFPERCVSCGTCREVCRSGTDPARCIACGACAEACPADARQLAGRMMRASEVVEILARDRVFYEESGGGVTFSGGEPFAQPAFLGALLQASKEEGLSTALDTCGFTSRKLLLEIAPLVDLFLYDVKVLDPARHRDVVGIPLEPILRNLDALGAAGATVWLRVPIVPAFTDDEIALARVARDLSVNPAIRRVNLLPYHATGSGKFRRLGRAYALDRVAPPSPGRMEALAAIFRAQGMDARVGG
ncbi:MAG TPA: glycyl-radical enzyme activating protein [Vicinamibacterales bacterium]|nr:glycyl-radical enzyme activating protein [Vicinamibacterales bacterium]